MTVVQNIPNTRITGPGVFPVTPMTQDWNKVEGKISRMVTPGGLDTLTAVDWFSFWLDFSTDGGTSWTMFGGLEHIPGGHIVLKDGSTWTDETVTIGMGRQMFPSGTQFRVRYDCSTPVRIQGTVTYL